MSSEFDISAALTLYLKHYPGRNNLEFDRRYGPDVGPIAAARVRELLNEAMKIEPDWERLSLREAGDYVSHAMGARHPDLGPDALEAIANFFSYMLR